MFALAAFAVANPASAEVLTYTFDPFTHFTFEDLDGASLMGTFTVNPPGDVLSSFDIVVGGTGQEAGTYEPEESGDNVLLYVDSATSNDLFLRFNEDLGAPHLQLTQVDWHDGAVSSTAVELGGGAQLPTVPEPSTWGDDAHRLRRPRLRWLSSDKAIGPAPLIRMLACVSARLSPRPLVGFGWRRGLHGNLPPA
jgi:hypothetical protein